MRLGWPLIFFGIFILGSGCSTPRAVENSREGLVQRLSDLDHPVKSGRRFERIDVPPLKGWVWPLKKVLITSPFGERNGKLHEGVDLRAGVGTPVYSAQAGRVVYAGTKISGYGKMIVVRHTDGIFSVYAHNSKLLVKKGRWLQRGQLLAHSGKTGHAKGPHVHFEIRKGVVALDPNQVIPNSAATVARAD